MSSNEKAPSPVEAAPQNLAPKNRLSPEQQAQLDANRAAVEAATQELIARMRSPEYKAEQERAKAEADALFRRAGVRRRPGGRGRGSYNYHVPRLGS